MSKSGICRLKITIDTSVVQELARGLEDVYSLCNDSYLRFGNDITVARGRYKITSQMGGKLSKTKHIPPRAARADP